MSFVWQDAFDTLKCYGHENGQPTDNQSQGPKWLFGSAGGLHTNAEEYARFLIELLQSDGAGQRMFEIQSDWPHAAGELPAAELVEVAQHIL